MQLFALPFLDALYTGLMDMMPALRNSSLIVTILIFSAHTYPDVCDWKQRWILYRRNF